jgi:hypothetical protein
LTKNFGAIAGDMSDSKPAFFYPSQMCTVQVQVMGADTVCASQDLGTACAENRHFVDHEYLKSIMGEEVVKNSLVVTATSLLTGTRKEPGERVLGMLPSLKVYIHVGEGTDNIWSVHTLSNVLVVDSLPVPLHVSLKTIEVYPKNQRGGLKATSFPPQHQTHPYWDEELRKTIHYIGLGY